VVSAIAAALNDLISVKITKKTQKVCSSMRRFSTGLGFGDPKFWRAFYAKREGHFEWFCEYSKCQPALKRHIGVADRVLHVRCGTSFGQKKTYFGRNLL
jgi:hypothetical protein